MFWNDVCTLEPQYVNVYDLKTRETYAYLSARYWGRLGSAQRTRVLDSIRKADGIPLKKELSLKLRKK
jgi:hypothetical protein